METSSKSFSEMSHDERFLLFTEDVEKFNILVKIELEKVIFSSGDKDRERKMQILQWQIQKELIKSKTPLGRADIMYNILVKRVYDQESGFLVGLMSNLKMLVNVLDAKLKNVE